MRNCALRTQADFILYVSWQVGGIGVFGWLDFVYFDVGGALVYFW